MFKLSTLRLPPIFGRTRAVGLLVGLGCSIGATNAQTYCPSDGGNGNIFNIARVQFADLNNQSGDNNGYADFTALAANVQPGQSYPVTLTPNGPFFLRYRWRVFIDWNDDGTFAAGELAFQQTGFGVETGTITVPAGTSGGTKRMRVNMSAFTYQGACANYAVGEVEDYSVIVPEGCDAEAGTITITKPFVCSTGESVNLQGSPDGNAVVPAGFETLYVLTQGPGLVIQQVASDPAFSVIDPGSYTIHTLVYNPATLDLSIVQPGVTTGFQVNGLLIQGGGTICASLDVAGGVVTVVKPLAGTLSGGATVCAADDVVLTATPDGNALIPTGYTLAYVLTSGSDLVIQQLGNQPSFTVNGAGLFTIHSFVFPSDLDLSAVQPGVTTGVDVLNLLAANNICASLDVAGAAFNVTNPDAGTLSGGADVCLTDSAVTLTATPDGNSNTPDGYSLAYVLTSGTDLVIEQLGANPSFTVTSGGLYTIHTFVFPSSLDLSVVEPGVTTGVDVLNLLAANNICASLDVAGAAFNVTNPDAGTLSGGADVCLTDSAVTLTATPDGNSNTPDGYSLAYVLTSGTGLVIEQLGANPSFTVTNGGLYTIHTFVFPSSLDLSVVEPGVTTGVDVLNLLAANNICASLDVAGAAFNVTNPDAGTLSGGADVCLTGDEVTLTATPDGNSNTPDGYSLAYVLTSGTGLVIEQLGANPSFDVTSGGLYTIHTFVFPSSLDLSVVEPGVTTGVDVLNLLAANNICASLDVAGAAFNVTNPDAGTLIAVEDSVCFLTGTVEIAATPNGGLNVPAGYSVIYVLTEGEGLVIQNVAPTPNFLVGASGDYTIHTLVYDPNTLDLSIVEPGVTTGFQVNSLLVQGGGSICASLDVAGAPVSATECEGCIADAGTMSGGGDVCGAGSAVLVAQANGDAVIPIGSTQAYVLTSGTGLVIEQLGTSPEFTVTSGGLYTIHSFVFPSGLDLSVVEPGVTTGVDVLNLIQATGICASLDVAGTVFNVTTPDAGTLTADGTPCLEGGAAVLTATPNGNSNTPDGYSLAYVLTSGTGLVIEQLGAAPEFTVTSAGLYTIHTFVFPSSLDLSVVEPGVTTGVDVLNLLAANNICASLDVAGAPFNVEACSDECVADAGDIFPASFIVCRQGGSATLTGIPAGNAVVPAGYQTLYVLTRGPGLVIRQVSPTPQFTVNQLGIYTIHTLVYDPARLDLSIVVPGQTTGFDVNALLIQGGGDICASLDVQGAPQIVLGPFICSIINLFNNGIAPQNMDELNDVLASSGMSGASADMVMNTIEQDLPLNVMSMYPNPTRDMLTIDMAVLVDTDLELSVLNALGQEVLPGTSLNVGRGANRSVIDVSTLPSGSYLVRLTMSDRVLTQRFTKVN